MDGFIDEYVDDIDIVNCQDIVIPYRVMKYGELFIYCC